jgi:iron complex transport system ATP-binding protein
MPGQFMSDLITCQSVGYRQQGTDILTDINWKIDRGQHWAVLGPNGSGKTTLLRIACGYLWPTSGRVLRLGEELIDLGELRRSIGWISSGMIAEIPRWDTGLETVVSGRFAQIGLKRLPDMEPTSADFADARSELSRLRCESLANKQFGILSQGERQQVLIARARMAKPLLLVLDEPCAGMDPGVRERFLAWLSEMLNDEVRMTNDEWRTAVSSIRHSSFDIRHSTPTTVLVTHHIEEIVPGFANTLVLSQGRVHSCGPTDQVVTRETIETVYRTRLNRLETVGGRRWPLWG